MVKLYDVYSYFDYSRCYVFDKEQVWDWSGQILVSEEGWFEGVINYSHEKKTEEYVRDNLFIYGVFVPGQGIKIVESVPYRYRSVLREVSIGTCILNNDGYEGYRSIGTDKFQQDCCAAKLDIKMVMSVALNRNEYRDVSKEIEKLQSALKVVRAQIPYRELYLFTYRKRKSITEELTTFKKSGKKFGRLKTPIPFAQARKLV